MGRERELGDPEAGPVARFAHDLLDLRRRAGNPDYRTMARRCGRAPSTLSTAVSGRALPTLETTLAFVRGCGADGEEQARWARVWKQVRTALDEAQPGATLSAPASVPPGSPDPGGTQEMLVFNPERRRAWRPRRSAAAAAGVAAAVIGVVVIAGSGVPHAPHASGGRPAGYRGPTATPSGQRPPAAAAATPEPERRHGPLLLIPGTVADLDSVPPDWGVRTSPGSADDDVEFTSSDHVLTGLGNADMAILPTGAVGTFDECALDQNYGVELPSSAIRPGMLLCDITSQDRVALLRVTDVQRDAAGIPDQVTLDVTVWVRLHKN